MTIKDAEKLTGLTIKSIRYYEEKGLISIGRNKDNDYRNYSKEDIERLKLIKILRYIDFSTEDISVMLKKDDITESLKLKSKQLEEKSNNYLEKQNICNSLIKDNKRKNINKIIDDYSDTIAFLETDEAMELKVSIIDVLCPSLSSIIIQSLIYIAPIIWLIINIYNKRWDALILNSIITIICTILLTSEWIYYFNYKTKHKETIKTKNKNNSLLIPILIISIISFIFLWVLLNTGIEQFFAPKDYLFFEISLIPSKLMIFAIIMVLITFIGIILKKFKINKSEDLDVYIEIWKKCKGILIILFIIISYCFITSVTFVTKDKIIYRDPLHPFGLSYSYDDVTKIETGFGRKNFSFLDYERKGGFYYRIYVDNKKITFSVPSTNEKIEKYNNDTYLELEEFDKKLMKKNIKKISDDKYANACDLDKEYCERFIRIINYDYKTD